MRRLNKLGLLTVFALLMTPTRARTDDNGGNNSNWLQKLGDSMGNASSDGSSDNQATSVAGVRGLEETGGNVNTKARDYAAVDRLEKIQITDAELKQFINEGQLK